MPLTSDQQVGEYLVYATWVNTQYCDSCVKLLRDMADPVTGYFSENYRVPRRSLDQHMYQTRDRSDSIDGSNDSASQGAAKEDDSDSDSQDSNYSMLQAQEEWEENVRQLQLAVSVLILPTLGKWLGRRWAYSSEQWRRRRNCIRRD